MVGAVAPYCPQPGNPKVPLIGALFLEKRMNTLHVLGFLIRSALVGSIFQLIKVGSLKTLITDVS